MKKVIREVKDLKPLITQNTICFVVSVIVAFFVDAIPFAFGIPIWLWFMIYFLLMIYSYFICLIIYKVFTPASHRVNKADIDTFLINKGKDLHRNKKIKIVLVNPFTMTIKYWTKNTSKQSVKYIFYIKKNIFKEFPSKCSQNTKNTL